MSYEGPVKTGLFSNLNWLVVVVLLGGERRRVIQMKKSVLYLGGQGSDYADASFL